MEIRDPIHGNIDINETELKIIDTPEMQRLRYVRQLDMTYLIFPGANHTRFEHSLGTMKVTKELVSAIYGKEDMELSCVGMLHDIGHGPFSHLSEHFMVKHLKKSHEQIGEERIRNSEIRDIISDSGMSFNRIMSYFKNADKIDVVGGAVGSDRIDYLMRDSHYTGVAYGIIDYDRLRSRLVLSRGRVGVLESGISGVESMLIARYFMHSNVYSHHAKVIANKMLQRAIAIAIESRALEAAELPVMYDDQLISRLRDSNIKTVVSLVERIMKRELFKRAFYGRMKKDIDVGEIENAIMKAGFGRSDFIVHELKLGGGRDDINVVGKDGKAMGALTELSPLIKTLSEVLMDSKRLLVACDKRNVERIGSIVKRAVG